MSNQGNVPMHDDCPGCGDLPDLNEEQWLALISKGVEGLKGEMATVSCYDAKRKWKKVEIIYNIEDRND